VGMGLLRSEWMSTDVETREASLLLNIFFVFVFVAKVAAGFSGSCGSRVFGSGWTGAVVLPWPTSFLGF
jgi:hypothetical protein